LADDLLQGGERRTIVLSPDGRTPMMDVRNAQDWGTVEEAEDRGQPSLLIGTRLAAASTARSYLWRPPDDLRGELPEGFVLPFRVHLGPDRLRRIAPVGTVKGFTAVAWLGGFAVLGRLKRPSAETLATYRMMWFLFGYAQRTREHLDRSFNCSAEFRVKEVGRSSARQVSVITTPTGYGSAVERHVPVKELKELGRKAAHAAGVPDPATEDLLHYGLVALSQRHPLSIPDDQVPELIRSSLFECCCRDQEPSPEVVDLVYERVCKAFLNRKNDTTAEFDARFWGPHNFLVQQISQQKRPPGGPLDRQVVRQAILRLGWDAYRYVGGCLSLQMQAVARSLPEPLTPSERAVFEQTHLSQPHFGGLPLVLLGKRLGFARSVIGEICEHPGDRRHVEVLHRLLMDYSDMTSARREADRKISRPREFELCQGRDSQAAAGPTRFSEIVAAFLRSRNALCGCETIVLQAHLRPDREDELEFSFIAACPGCGRSWEDTIPPEDLAKYEDLPRGRDLLPSSDRPGMKVG
jgi:hypothetical protein